LTVKLTSVALLFICYLTSCKETNEQLINKGIRLSDERKYDEAIAIYTDVIKRNPKLPLAYYNRGIAYMYLEKYKNALADFNKIIASQQNSGPFKYVPNPNSPFAKEEDRAFVSYYEALYQRAQVKYHMDSVQSSYRDFTELIENYYEVSNCYLWQGTLWMRAGNREKACERFDKATIYARTEEDRQEADRMTKEYCAAK